MTDSAPTELIGLRKQSLSSNTNLWGDPYLNDNFDTLSRAIKGWQAVAMTGDSTVSETNYSDTNETAVALIKLTGSLSAVANYIIPARPNFFVLWNTSGQTITVKHAASTGVAIANNRTALIASDGSEVYNVTPNYIAAITEANDRDIVDKGYVDSAIAAATIPAATGAVKISGADTTPGYLNAKIAIAGAKAVTYTSSIASPGADEDYGATVSVEYTALAWGGTLSTQSSVAVNTRYIVNCQSTAVDVYLPTNSSIGDTIRLAKGGTNNMSIKASLTTLVNGSSAVEVGADELTLDLTYHSSARGYV